MSDGKEFKGLMRAGMFIVDEQGAEELRAAHEELLARIDELEAESMKRSAETGEPTERVFFGIYHKEHRPSNN
ncbi:MAG TPA: hypothetical protein VFT79_02610 [Solirubrobacterales bacterium]|nr:hypothetical protein [Solirubrobacterales bacterium]